MGRAFADANRGLETASVTPRLSDQRPPAMIEIEHVLLARLRSEAARRDMPVNSLIRALLDTLVRDKLVAAVLDE
jgi:hypothetical protein